MLLGRAQEFGALDELLADLHAGRGRSMTFQGEAGIGKSALLDALVEQRSWILLTEERGTEAGGGAGREEDRGARQGSGDQG